MWLSTFCKYMTIARLCKQQADIVQSHENSYNHNIGTGEAALGDG